MHGKRNSPPTNNHTGSKMALQVNSKGRMDIQVTAPAACVERDLASCRHRHLGCRNAGACECAKPVCRLPGVLPVRELPPPPAHWHLAYRNKPGIPTSSPEFNLKDFCFGKLGDSTT